MNRITLTWLVFFLCSDAFAQGEAGRSDGGAETYGQAAQEESTYESLRSAIATAQLRAQEEMKGPSGANYAYEEFTAGYTVEVNGRTTHYPGIYQRLGSDFLRGIEAKYEELRQEVARARQENYHDVRAYMIDKKTTNLRQLRDILKDWQQSYADLDQKLQYHRDRYVHSDGKDELFGWYQDQSRAFGGAIWALRDIIRFMEAAHGAIPALHRVVAEASALPPQDRLAYIQAQRPCLRLSGER